MVRIGGLIAVAFIAPLLLLLVPFGLWLPALLLLGLCWVKWHGAIVEDNAIDELEYYANYSLEAE